MAGEKVYASMVLPDIAGGIDGVKVVVAAGTAERLAPLGTFAKYVWITAKATNTNRVMIGASTVVAANGATARGKPLYVVSGIPDVIPMPVPGFDLGLVYVDAITNGEGVMYFALT